MAGILAIYKKKSFPRSLINEFERLAFKIKNRGIGRTIKYESFNFFLIYHANNKKSKNISNNCYINNKEGKIIAIDGQIYNLKQVYHKYFNNLEDNYENITELNLLFDLFKSQGKKILKQLYGFFSGIFFDGNNLIGFKDSIGSKPLYYCDTKEFFVISSELKVLSEFNIDIKQVMPASIVYSSGFLDQFYEHTKFSSYDKTAFNEENQVALKLNRLVKNVIKECINQEEKISVLLSGGLDSAIVTHIANTFIKGLKVYTVGTKNSKDIQYAKKFSEFYKLKHRIIEVNFEDMINILPDVIYALETFDAALIRSAIPMFVVSKIIKEEDEIEVLLTGEGGDELFGGYDYLKKFESNDAFNQELMELLKCEYKTGLQRVDRIPYNFSIEARAPLFDRRLVEFSLTIPIQLKIYKKDRDRVIEKWILRKAFENEIPPHFIWRKKQKFSEGVGSQFLIRDYIEKLISDEEFSSEKKIIPSFSLRSKEELYYWRIFKGLFKPTVNTIKEIGITSNFEI